MLHLAEPTQPRGMRLPIDVLFSSLARELGDRAIGVVLSGMGSDGTLGLQAIKTQGGLTLVQSPRRRSSTRCPGAPSPPAAPTIVALPAEMPARILSVTGVLPPAAPPWANRGGRNPSALDAILGLLHERSKHDLTEYKSNTLVRRIERRMAVHGMDTMDAYADFLRENAQEVDLLFKRC